MASTSPAEPQASEMLDTSYEIFVALLSLLSIGNLIVGWIVPGLYPDARNVLRIIDGFLSLIFLFDFARRMHAAPVKRRYFIRGGGWADLLSATPIPGLRLLRVWRIWVTGRSLREAGLRSVVTEVSEERAESALYVAVFLVLVVLEATSVAVLYTERGAAGANITTASDAVWWGYVTVTTVGYGDQYPVTNAGRLVGVALLTSGVALFAVVTGFIANAFLAPRRRPRRLAALVEASTPKQRLAAIRREMEAQEQAMGRLKKQLNEVEAIL